MKINLVFFVLLAGLWLPNHLQAQVLTPMADTIDYNSPDTYNRAIYSYLGTGAGVLTGSDNMRKLTEGLGFEQGRIRQMFSAGFGGRFRDRFYAELGISFLISTYDDLRLSGGRILELKESALSGNLLFGYGLWQSDRNGLVLWAGPSVIGQVVQITERQEVDFNFDTFSNTGSTQDVRTWPLFVHGQGALHLALEWRTRPFMSRNPRANAVARAGCPRTGVSSDLAIRLGYVGGFQETAWEVDYGNVSNAPVDRNAFMYLSVTGNLSYNYRRK